MLKETEVIVRTEDGLTEQQIKAIQVFFQELLPFHQEENYSFPRQPTAEDVYSRLELSGKYKLGKHPYGESRKKNIAIAHEYIQEKKPIATVSTTGTSKWYDGSNPDVNVAGFSELMMLEQFSHINRRTKNIYSPGLKSTLLAEDATNQWLYGQLHPNVPIAQNNERYLHSLSTLIESAKKQLDIDIELVRENEILKKMGMSHQDYYALCELNQAKFKRLFGLTAKLEKQFLEDNNISQWLEESWNQFLEEELPAHPEYLDLANIGWLGGVHPKARNYYIGQFKKSTNLNGRELNYLAAYYGGVLARRQLRFFTSAAGGPAIKIALIRYPSQDLGEKQNAIQLSAHPLTGLGSSHQLISSWASYARIAIGSNGSCNLDVMPAKNNLHLNKEKKTVQLEYAGATVPVDVVIEK